MQATTEKLISVIIPVYNIQAYLPRCVESVCAQTHQKLEILLVDDGSTDGTGALCDRLGASDSRIRVFHKENGGSSSARNLGLEKAQGEYIGFVDSDDFISPEMYERLLDAMVKYQVRVTQIGRDEMDENGNRLPDICVPPSREERIDHRTFFKELLLHRGDCSFCTKLFHRSLLEGKKFPEGALNEDFHFLVELLPEIGELISLPEQTYHVFYRMGSNSRKKDKEQFSRVYGDCVDNADKVQKLIDPADKELLRVAERFGIFQRLEYLLHIPISQMKRDNIFYRKVVKDLRHHFFRGLTNPYLTAKNKLYMTLFSVAPSLVRKVHRRLRLRKQTLGMLLIFSMLCGLVGFPMEAMAAATAVTEQQSRMALVYLCDSYDVRSEAGKASLVCDVVESGQTVWIQSGSYNEAEDTLWIYVKYYDRDEAKYGYIERKNLVSNGEVLQEMDRRFVREYPHAVRQTTQVTEDIAQFPESYQAGLMALKEEHPGWVFVPMNTGLDWNTVITEELKGGKSLVHKSLPDYAKDGPYDSSGNWFYATRGILEYYMDPRNAMREDRIFQFEFLVYNEQYHTEKAVDQFLSDTFMNNSVKAPGTVMTFGRIIQATGAEFEVSPFHLAARIVQEQGKMGTSSLISGTYPGYEGYYNYFNIGASGTSNKQVIENGLLYAKQKGWNSAYTSIYGGSDIIANRYIKKGQDTLYLEKYNVNPKASNALYTHQYMQNITAPTSESVSIKKQYVAAGLLNSSFVFKIPVYKNMPSEACPYPAESTILTLTIPEGYDSTTIWVDGKAFTTTTKDGKQSVDLKNKTSTTAVAYSYDEAGVPDGMHIWLLGYVSGNYTVSEQTGLDNLLSYHGFSVRVSGEPGLRMKSGIDGDLKDALTGSGVGGCRLKEYGTLVTDTGKIADKPFVKGTAGVMTGLAYGTNYKGQKIDNVYETMDQRKIFTAVFVGMRKEEYTTDYAFRSYAVLTKSGKNYTIYGPILTRQMVQVAEQALQSGAYSSDSTEYLYLQQLIEAAGN